MENCKVIAITNQKGGVGKTTTAVNLGVGLASSGKNEGKLSQEVIESIMSEEKPNQKEKINIKYEDARKFIPASVPYNKTGDYIMKALEYYHRYQERQCIRTIIGGKPKEVDPMRKTLMIITVALVLCLCGCSEVLQSSDIPTEPVRSESLPIKKSEEISQETDAPQSSVDIDTPEESGIASETTVSDVKETESTPQPKDDMKQDPPKDETRATGDSVTTSSFELVKPSTEPTETKPPEIAPDTEKPKETEEPKTTEAPKETEPPAPPVETEPEPEQEPPFDINYWISYAQGVAFNKGLTLESSAVDCWDNPITANPDCIYLERDITSRMNRYAKDEDITIAGV